MSDEKMLVTMAEISEVLKRNHATIENMLTVGRLTLISAIGDLTNRTEHPDRIHHFADGVIEKIREAMHRRIDEGLVTMEAQA